MGWNTGNDVFDPIARHLIKEIKYGHMTSKTATRITTVLITALQELDWDTEDESEEEFKEIDWIREAFEEVRRIDGDVLS